MGAKTQYDVIVLGLGAMGGATLRTLAKRGHRVCGVEQHHIAHDLGSSHGTLRMIRRAYFEHPAYMPLLERAYGLWKELEDEAGLPILTEHGLMISGAPDSDTIRGLEACYTEHRVPHERISAEEARHRFPALHPPDGHAVFYDPSGGYLFAERTAEQQIELAERHGAQVYLHETVLDWKADGDAVTVTTDKRDITASRLVITLGPWAAQVLAEIGVNLKVVRKTQQWYRTPDEAPYLGPEFPCFAFDLGDRFFYGFPPIDEQSIKVAEHTGEDGVADPDSVGRALDAEDEKRVQEFLRLAIPGLHPELVHFSVCMYTNSPDEHFILDTHPQHDTVIIGAGFSGHGFKFTPVIGEILADLAIEGRTSYEIDFLRLARFGV